MCVAPASNSSGLYEQDDGAEHWQKLAALDFKPIELLRYAYHNADAHVHYVSRSSACICPPRRRQESLPHLHHRHRPAHPLLRSLDLPRRRLRPFPRRQRRNLRLHLHRRDAQLRRRTMCRSAGRTTCVQPGRLRRSASDHDWRGDDHGREV